MGRKIGSKNNTGEMYTLRDDEKIWLGLVRTPIRHGNVLIAIPHHYTSASVQWSTQWVSDWQLPKYRCGHPNLQVLEVRRMK